MGSPGTRRARYVRRKRSAAVVLERLVSDVRSRAVKFNSDPLRGCQSAGHGLLDYTRADTRGAYFYRTRRVFHEGCPFGGVGKVRPPPTSLQKL